MKVIFFGTPDYVLPILKGLDKVVEITAVVTQPPKPVGRKQFLEYSPVDTWAHKRKLPIFFNFTQPLPGADLGILASYGRKIPLEVIKHFPHGILVVHPSLLPKYRGTSPVQTAIKEGEQLTGVSIIKMDEKFDHGPIVAQFKEEILATDTYEALRDRLFSLSVPVLLDLLSVYVRNKIKLRPQDENLATNTKKMTREDGYLDLNKTKAEEAERFIRAMTPWPGAWILLRQGFGGQAKRLKILRAHLEKGKLLLDKVQLEGKNQVSWKQFQEAYPKAKFTPFKR